MGSPGMGLLSEGNEGQGKCPGGKFFGNIIFLVSKDRALVPSQSPGVGSIGGAGEC
jgi:hypothetical protein